MPTLRRSRYLTCFYCGRKTSTRNDGSVRHFECPSCDATNYLDENGEITDPPLEATAASIRADPKPSLASPEPASSDVFCATCLKNQRIFTSSLAQYLPDDPDDPEYEERERNFYKYRKGLEKQYPQVCAQCEPKVLQRIDKAGYTAKTDHLRRMIDRSRQERTPTATTSLLGVVGALGRYLWIAGFVLQALWHVSIVRELASQYRFSAWEYVWGHRLLVTLLDRFFSLLPSPERLMKWSITVTATSIWWNPFLVQTIRGFTKHLLGFSTWYTYQAIIMLFRILALAIPNLSSQGASEVPTQVAAHAFMLGFMLFISKLALGSIRTDTTPLFASTPKKPLAIAESSPQPARATEPASMSDILDDVLASPSAPALDSSPSFRASNGGPKFTGRYPSPEGLGRRPLWGAQESGLARAPITPPNSDPFAAPQEAPSVQYDMEMDWTPTQSKHRAFSSFGAPQEPLRGFGQAPVEDGQRRQFWYKVPPAPTSIAQRALNPPAAARLRKQPPVEERTTVFGQGFSSQGPSSNAGEDRHDVAFKETSFFPEANNDPRNTLSDLFGQAFSISPSQERPGGKRTGGGSGSGGQRQAAPPARWGSASDVALILVSAMLLIPGYATLVAPEYDAHLALGVCCMSLVIWAKVGLDTAWGFWATRRPWVLTPAVGSLLGASELAVTARISLQRWADGRGLEACLAQGNWFVLILVLHQLWNAFLGPLVQHRLTGVGVQVRR